jgi:putative two-component system response regulator
MNRTIQNTERNRILIVDDEPINIQILTGILEAEYDLNAATGGEIALKIAKTVHPDLILLDMIMPGMDGIALCHALKQEESTREIPIIFVTGLKDPENEKRGFEAGAVDYISKPISPPIVQARVKVHIQNFLTVKFLQDMLDSRDISIEEAKTQAESLLVFV